MLWELVSATTARKCYHRSHCERAGLRTPAALHIRALVQHSWTICCSEALLEYSEAAHGCSEAVVRANRPSQGRIDTSCLVLRSIYTQTTASALTTSMDTPIVCQVSPVSSEGRAPTNQPIGPGFESYRRLNLSVVDSVKSLVLPCNLYGGRSGGIGGHTGGFSEPVCGLCGQCCSL